MNAIKKVRSYIEANPDSESSRALVQLIAALGDEKTYPLADLYRVDYGAFELALELMRDWRLDRYYASRIKLFDVVQRSEQAANAP